MADVIRGIIPVIPTIFHDDETLDLEGLARVVDFAVDAESDAICVLANYSEQFSLDDAERIQVAEAAISAADGRVPVMITTSHFSAAVTNRRNLDAQRRGASAVMIMPPFFGATMSVNEAGVVDYFARATDGLEIDVMIQDAPLSTTSLSVPTLATLARSVPNLRYAKIEVPRTAQKIRELRDVVGGDLPGLYDGEESVTLIPDLHAGAQGTMSSCVIPERLGAIVRSYLAGDEDDATADWEAVLPLIHFENRQCGLSAAKLLLQAGGVIASARTRAPIAPLHPDTVAGLLHLARRADALALRWAA